MAIHLSDRSDHVTLDRVVGDTRCAWTGDEIESGSRAVALHEPSSGALATPDPVWVSIGALSSVQATLDNFDPTTHDLDDAPSGGHGIAPSSDVRYHRLEATGTHPCVYCDESCERGEGVITWFHSHEASASKMTKVRLHPDCLDDFIDALDDVWDYAADILADRV